ncbi:hypothetical protein RI129_003120 [Pyrocoelia pectoralis]|uniref:Uncharacterized protein n=1 Tax=Pyrocoelia pectoralis TaxID=417401 RepID=A0AAN7VPQ5_9COLE
MASPNKLSVQELADMLEDEEFWEDIEKSDHVQSVYIEPPDKRELSDEDSADEDSGGLLDNLSGKQLLANAEIVMDSGRRIGNFDTIRDSDISDNVPSTSFIKEKNEVFEWLKKRRPYVQGRNGISRGRLIRIQKLDAS